MSRSRRLLLALSLLCALALPAAAIGTNALSFIPPLGPGTNSLWLQQTGSAVIGCGDGFVVVPEPTAAALSMLGVLGLAFVGRRR